MSSRYVVTAALWAVALSAGVPAVSWAQTDQDELNAELEREQATVARNQARMQREALRAADRARHMAESQFQFRGGYGMGGGQPRHLTAIQAVAEKLRDADESDKSAAEQKLRDLIDRYFEEDMKRREQELSEIEARLAKLEAQLERRRAKKGDIVELQYQLAINESEGLGFTAPPSGAGMWDLRIEAPVMVAPIGDALKPAAVPAPPKPPKGTPQPLSFGSEGDEVRRLQEILNERVKPSLDIAVDGDFGPETEEAVGAFQAQHDLKVTGIVDEKTRKELGLDEPAE